MVSVVDVRRSLASKLKETGQRLLTIHRHTLLYGYRFSIGPTEGLSLKWPTDLIIPDSQSIKQSINREFLEWPKYLKHC